MTIYLSIFKWKKCSLHLLVSDWATQFNHHTFLQNFLIISIPKWSNFLELWSKIGPLWAKRFENGLILHSNFDFDKKEEKYRFWAWIKQCINRYERLYKVNFILLMSDLLSFGARLGPILVWFRSEFNQGWSYLIFGNTEFIS